jgi:hypothetical protein
MVVANLGQRATERGIVETGTFTVDVTCPGADNPHSLRFMGSYEK